MSRHSGVPPPELVFELEACRTYNGRRRGQSEATEFEVLLPSSSVKANVESNG